MEKWQRSFFQPVLPLGEDGRRVTGSKEHIALSRMAAGYPERIKEAYEKGFIIEAEIRLSARRILNMILKID